VTREEWRAGFLRLGLGLLAVAFLACAISTIFWAAGTPPRRALASGVGLTAVFPLLGGVVVWMSSGPFVRVGPPVVGHGYRRASEDERMEKEKLAAGLIGLGVVLFACTLALG
jgi:hypothetical protein